MDAERFSDTFARAVFPPRCRVAGVRLVPFTLGHALLLQRVASPFDPFAEESRPAEHGDTALALWILSHDWSAASRRMDGRMARWQLAALAGRLWLTGGSAAAGLRQFLRAASAAPEARPTGEPSHASTTPIVPLLLMAVMRDWGFTWTAALELPVTVAWWLHLSLLEAHDVIAFATPEFVAAAEAAAWHREHPEEMQAWVRSEADRLGIRLKHPPGDPSTPHPSTLN